MAGVVLVPPSNVLTNNRRGSRSTSSSSTTTEVTTQSNDGRVEKFPSKNTELTRKSEPWLSDFQLALLAEGNYYDTFEDGEQDYLGRKFSRDRSTTLFIELDELLRFDHPKVRVECAGMLARIVPRIDRADLDLCVGHVLPSLVENLGHDDRDVRESSAHALVIYLKHASDVEASVGAVVARAFGQRDPIVRNCIINHLHLIYSNLEEEDNDCSSGSECLDALFRCLVSQMSRGGEHGVVASTVLNNMRDVIGEQKFSSIQRSRTDTYEHGVQGVREKNFVGETNVRERVRVRKKPSKLSFVSMELMERLSNLSDYKGRIIAAEQLKGILKEIQEISIIVDELPKLLSLLSSMLNDSNFKVTLITVDIYGSLIDKLNWRTQSHLRRIVGDLAVHLGQNKVVVRSQTSKVIAILISTCGASPVVTALLDTLRESSMSRNSAKALNPKAREEILNEIIIALSKYPSYEFDLYDVCSKVAPSLLDSKRRVRHAVLECLAVLAQAMGPSKLATVAAAIDAAAEPHHDTEGALAAVLARLARRQLPRVDSDGRVEYSLRVDTAAARDQSTQFGRHRGQGLSEGADVDWIMAGSSSLFDSSVLRNSRLQPASFPNSPAAPRRIVSPGHAKNSLPWTEKPTRPRIQDRSTPSINNRDDSRTNNGVSAGSSPASLLLSGATNSDRIRRSSDDSLNAESTLEMASPWTAASDHSSMSNSSLDRLSNTGSSYRILYSGNKSPHSDKASSRPLDKVAAMLGPNLLPSKLRPIADTHTNHRGRAVTPSSMSTTIVPLSGDMHGPPLHSNTWPGQIGTGSLPALPTRKNLLGPLADPPPVPTRPKLVRSSSGGRRRRSTITAENLQQVHQPINRRRDHSTGRISNLPDSRDVSPKSERSRPDTRQSINEYRGYSSVNNYEDENDGSNANEYGERASVDSGVESLLRPNSSSPAIIKVLGQPRNVDLNSSSNSSNNSSNNDDNSRSVDDQQNSVQNQKMTEEEIERDNVEKDRVENPSFTSRSSIDGSLDGSAANTGSGAALRSVSTETQSIVSSAMESNQSSSNSVQRDSPSVIDKSLNNITNGINVVGKGMLPSNKANGNGVIMFPSALQSYSERNVIDNDHIEDDDSLPSIQGRSVNNGGLNQNEDLHAMSLSRSTFNKMMHRQMEIQQEAERRKDVERHENMRTDDVDEYGNISWLEKAVDDDDGDRQLDNNNDGVELNRQYANRGNKPAGLQPKSPPGKPAATRKKLRGYGSTKNLSITNSSLSGVLSTPTEVALVREGPEEALKMAYQKLGSDEWQSKCQGIRIVDALVKHSPDIIATDIHNVNVAIVNEVKNLRSTVARTAIQCLAELFTTVKKHMEIDLDMICRALLHKSGESNVFIKQDVERALDSMVDAVTPQKACVALISAGATHRNAAVRKIAAQFVCALCERLGPSRVLSGQKDVTERILPTAANFVMDGSPLTRYYGRKIFFMLMSSAEFDRAIKQHLQTNTLRNIQEILENLRTKGLGNIPNESASSRLLKASVK